MKTRFLLPVACLLLLAGCAKTKDWPMYRQNDVRNGGQRHASDLSRPSRVPSLAVRWTFSVPAADTASGMNSGFRASPVVHKDRVYVGSGNGRMYALDANTGAVLWKFPAPPAAPLRSQFTCNPSSEGIASSAVVAKIGGVDAVIFGAPDPTVGTNLGEGRLFALNAVTGAEIWRSQVVARLTGTTSGSTTQFHQQIGYSSPVVYDGRIYVGVGDHCDNPIQKGRIVSVRLSDGSLDPAFTFCATGTCSDTTRGGGVWSGVAAKNNRIYATTGNSNNGGPEPAPNHGLSMIQLDSETGALGWKFQPVPYALDWDPDWAAGPNVMSTSCGVLSTSTMKDGWTHALTAATGARRWTFPTATIPFTSTDGTVHGDSRFMRAGAAWRDVFITMTGGLTVSTSLSSGYRRLHALNVCATDANRIRWIVDVPNTSGFTYSLGVPTVTRGIVYIGTDQGHLVAIADPDVAPAAGMRCSNTDVTAAACVASGYTLVPQPAVLANVTLSGSMVYNEAAISKGRLFVATGGGNVYMLRP
jgi:outer membrane protein assembly factor BamB